MKKGGIIIGIVALIGLIGALEVVYIRDTIESKTSSIKTENEEALKKAIAKVSPEKKDDFFEAGGVIRPDENGNWYLLNNIEHESLHLGEVSQTSDYVEVQLPKDSGLKKIQFASITPDDSLVLADTNTGASVSASSIKIFFAKSGTLINPNEYNQKNYTWYHKINVWIYVRGTKE